MYYESELLTISKLIVDAEYEFDIDSTMGFCLQLSCKATVNVKCIYEIWHCVNGIKLSNYHAVNLYLPEIYCLPEVKVKLTELVACIT